MKPLLLIPAVGVLAAVATLHPKLAPPPAGVTAQADASRPPDPALQNAPQVKECDQLAAHPDDPQRRAPGVADKELIPALAIPACEAALGILPQEPRLRFQLGRAHIVAKRSADAEPHLQQAAAASYKPAMFYLAENILFTYWTSAETTQLQAAHQWLTTAKDDFEPAATRLHQLTFDRQGFQSPVIVEAFYNDQIDQLQGSRALVAFYARGFDKAIAMDFSPYGQACRVMANAAIQRDLAAAAAGDPANIGYGLLNDGVKLVAGVVLKFLDPVWRGDPQKYFDYLESLGERDGHYLAHSWGCSAPVTRDVYAGLVHFARTPNPLGNYLKTMLDGHPKTLFLTSGPSETN
jgi:hypothetical protein